MTDSESLPAEMFSTTAVSSESIDKYKRSLTVSQPFPNPLPPYFIGAVHKCITSGTTPRFSIYVTAHAKSTNRPERPLAGRRIP